jgi:hypothetical protein
MQRILVAAVALVGACGLARADVPELGGTSWFTTNDACDIDEIDFSSDGTATIYDIFSDDSDTGHWTLAGEKLTVDYDGWFGGIEGTVGEKRIEAVETWRSDKTKEVHHDPCIFELE